MHPVAVRIRPLTMAYPALAVAKPPPLTVPDVIPQALKTAVRALGNIAYWVNDLERRLIDFGQISTPADQFEYLDQLPEIREEVYARPTDRGELRTWRKAWQVMRHRLHGLLPVEIAAFPSINAVIGPAAAGPYDLRVFLDELTVWTETVSVSRTSNCADSRRMLGRQHAHGPHHGLFRLNPTPAGVSASRVPLEGAPTPATRLHPLPLPPAHPLSDVPIR